MPIEYDTFPLKKFWKILENESLLETYGIKVEDWNSLKEEWNEKHPSPESQKIVEASRKVILEDLRLKNYLLLARLVSGPESDYREFYEIAKVKYHETANERIDHLNKQISKSQQKIEIFNAQKNKLVEGLKENQEQSEETKRTDLNEVLASFEIAGISVGNYEEMTLGRYDGLNKVFERKERQSKK